MSKEITPENPTAQTESQIELVELGRAIWARRRLILRYVIIGAVLGLIIGFSIPNTYTTSVKLAPESKAANTGNNISGLAAMAGINLGQEIAVDGITTAIYPDIIESTPFLLEFAGIPIHLTSDSSQKMTMLEYITDHQKKAWWGHLAAFPGKIVKWIRSKPEDVPPVDSISVFSLPVKYKKYTQKMSKLLSVTVDKKTSLLDIRVTMQDPWVSAMIADSVISKLQRYMILYKTQKTRHDLEQSIRQNNEARTNYYAAEDRLVEAADKNRTISTEALRVRIERLRNESELAFNVYNQTASQVEMNRIKLQEETPIATIVEPAIVPHKPASPQKLMLFFGIALLGGVVAIVVLLFRILFPGSSSRNSKSTNGKAVASGAGW